MVAPSLTNIGALTSNYGFCLCSLMCTILPAGKTVLGEKFHKMHHLKFYIQPNQFTVAFYGDESIYEFFIYT